MNRERYLAVLKKLGKETVLLKGGDGQRLTLLPYGARVLGLYAPGSDQNFLWTNPAIHAVDAARALFAGDGWHNTGGDRTWLTPELDIFFPDYPDVGRHCAPRALDASDYRVVRTGHEVGLQRRFRIRLARANRTVEVALAKYVSFAPNPLRHESEYRPLRRLSYAGYNLRTTLRLVGDRKVPDSVRSCWRRASRSENCRAGAPPAAVHPDSGNRSGCPTMEREDSGEVQMGLWNLLQLPFGGEVLVPTYARTRPKVLFGRIAPRNLVVTDRLVRFRIVAEGDHKIAIRAVATTGRAGYLYRCGQSWALVIRNSLVNPSGEYVDVPKFDPDDRGYAFHAVNVNSSIGRFCELEYHAPAIGAGTGRTRCVDESQVWAFRGTKAQMAAIARVLLAAAI